MWCEIDKRKIGRSLIFLTLFIMTASQDAGLPAEIRAPLLAGTLLASFAALFAFRHLGRPPREGWAAKGQTLPTLLLAPVFLSILAGPDSSGWLGFKLTETQALVNAVVTLLCGIAFAWLIARKQPEPA